MSKNPYELRYEIYQQAQQRVMDKYYQDHEIWANYEEWKRDREAEGEVIKARPAVPDRPFFPTHEEILCEANKIYDFVQRCN